MATFNWEMDREMWILVLYLHPCQGKADRNSRDAHGPDFCTSPQGGIHSYTGGRRKSGTLCLSVGAEMYFLAKNTSLKLALRKLFITHP